MSKQGPVSMFISTEGQRVIVLTRRQAERLEAAGMKEGGLINLGEGPNPEQAVWFTQETIDNDPNAPKRPAPPTNRHMTRAVGAITRREARRETRHEARIARAKKDRQ